MKAVDIKRKLIEEINLSHNESLLEEMYNFLNQDNKAGLYKLSEEQKNAVAEARDQLKNGQSFTNNQVNDEMEEWLKGK